MSMQKEGKRKDDDDQTFDKSDSKIDEGIARIYSVYKLAYTNAKSACYSMRKTEKSYDVNSQFGSLAKFKLFKINEPLCI